MKNSFLTVTLMGCIAVNAQAQSNTLSGQLVGSDVSSPCQLVSAHANMNVWQRTVMTTNAPGKVSRKVHKYNEMASGLNHLQNGQWTRSTDEIVVLADGSAAATNIQHQVNFPDDIYQGAITVTTPDGQQLQSRPALLCYVDGTNSVILADLQDSSGELVGSNKVVYPQAFSGLNADLLYISRVSGLEQDVVFRQRPPTPESLGLNPQTTTLELLTEFINSTEPVVKDASFGSGNNLQDNTLTFGKMSMIQGRAFSTTNVLGTGTNTAPVCKSWLQTQGRDFLVEKVLYSSIVPQLGDLAIVDHKKSGFLLADSRRNKSSRTLLLPPARAIKRHPNSVRFARSEYNPNPGVVLDYFLVDGTYGDITFQADTTYLVSDYYFEADGTATFEGGTVIKFANGSGGFHVNEVVFDSGPYRPVIFTALDDDTVGETISGSTGTPSGYYGNGIVFTQYGENLEVHDVRMSYLNWGIEAYANSVEYDNIQAVNCDVPIAAFFGNIFINNGLFYNDVTAVANWGGTPGLYGTHVTAHDCGTFSQTTSLSLVNSLMVNATNLLTGGGSLTTDTVVILTNDTGIFQIVGSGGHYLASGSPYRNIGSTNISSDVAAELAERTTYPPMVYGDGTVFTTNTTLNPFVQRDTNAAPDLGYHYDPLDYVVADATISNNVVLNLTAGTVLGWYHGDGYGPGLTLSDGAEFYTAGTATSPCWVSHTSLVQEGNGNWENISGVFGVELNGDNATNQPEIIGSFTKWSGLNFTANLFDDSSAYGTVGFISSEFYNGAIASYQSDQYYTNCLFYRESTTLWGGSEAASFTYQNCTFYNGAFLADRFSGQSPTFWTIQNSSFDGTAFNLVDNFNGTNYTDFNYNAYNTNNLSWQTYEYYSPMTNTLEVVGPNDVFVGDFDWQTSWFGDFYLPANSPLIDAGSATANRLGLYWFTTQTNQTVEGDSTVDIGYHYVTTDTNGNPIDVLGNGVPDYQADANGDGLVDGGETNWALEIVTPPANQSINQNTNAVFSVTAIGLEPISYQWYFGTNAITGDTASSLILTNVQFQNEGNYYVLVSNNVVSLTSTSVLLTVLVPPSITNQPMNQTVAAGQTATFSVTATGSAPLGYQWYFNSIALGGSTATNLVLTNAMPSYDGNYFVIITNAGGVVTSTVAILTVTSPTSDSDYDGRNDGQEVLDGTDPFNPNSVLPVRLGYWQFDNTNTWAGYAGQLPLLATNVSGIVSWSTNAVHIDSINPAALAYRDVETNGNANINLRSGTVRFWFRPDWSGTNIGGGGPGTAGRLIEVGSYNPVSSTNSGIVYYTNGWWSLYLSPDGSQLSFGSTTNGFGGVNLTASIAWATNQWHQIALTYTPTNSLLYLDGQLSTNGLGAAYYPNLAERASGFRIGSDANGNNQARGAFDELETFNYALPSSTILTNYQTVTHWSTGTNGLPNIWQMNNFGYLGVLANGDPDNDHLNNLQEYQLGTNPNNPDTDGDGRSDWQEVMDGTDPLNPNSKATWLVRADQPNVSFNAKTTPSPQLIVWFTNATWYFGVTNAAANKFYDVFASTNLVNWSWYGKIAAGGQYLLIDPTKAVEYYELGGPLDSDGDGLSDAYEELVTHTDPNDPDSDYDGRSDGQEVYLDSTDPNNPNSVTNVMMAYFRFDNTNTWVGEQGQSPMLVTNVVGVPSWGTNAVRIDSTTPAILKYHDVEPTNYAPANINCRQGTLQLWFAPDWNSGSGPGVPGRLVEMGSQSPTTGWWSLYFTNNGTLLKFGTQTNGLALTNLTASINWVSNYWHQIILTYSTNNSSLYVDGLPVVTNGLGTIYYPSYNERTNGFFIGSDLNGNNQARGTFDELKTYNYALSAGVIFTNYQNTYQSLLQSDLNGDGMGDLWEMNYFGTLNVSPTADPDSDGLSTFQEWLMRSQGYNPVQWNSFTNSVVGDGYQNYSGDGLANLMEASFGGNMLTNNPTWRVDSDGDGLPNSYKTMVGVSTNSVPPAPGLPAYSQNPIP